MCKICRGEKLEGLKTLDCYGCDEVKEIPNIVGLKVLICNGCVELEKIPNIVGLERLYCDGCVKLEKIPNIVGLEWLDCDGCGVCILKKYKVQIESILYIQKWWRWRGRWGAKRRKIEYWAPDGIGGRAQKRLLANFCEEIFCEEIDA